MEITVLSLVLLPIGLGLLGFVEPCTIGGHLVFLETQKSRPLADKWRAVGIFVVLRALVAGLVGALAGFLGQKLVSAQTGLWLVFGTLYLGVGLAFLTGHAGRLKKRLELAPAAWRRATSPWLLGAAFGLNIPACAAPILFALLGFAASTGAVVVGFVQMALFGLFLSLPLVLFVALPGLTGGLARIGSLFRNTGRVIGVVFILLGLWSIWFGLYVNPADWVGSAA